MNADVNAVWQSLRGAAEAGCLPSANMNSEGARKQVPALHKQHFLFTGAFLATEGQPGDGRNATVPLASGQMLQSDSLL